MPLTVGLPPVTSVLMGVLTGVGGGLLRDVAAGRTPSVLKEDVYALPALAGSMVVVIAWQFGLFHPIVEFTGAALCIVLRLLAIRHGWQMPRPGEFS